MDSKNTKSATCMACACPCEMHKEHNHLVEGSGQSSAKVCQMCGHEHKADSTCDCGCK